MIVDALKKTNSLVLEVATKGYPASPSQTFTGVVVQAEFVLLNSEGVTGEKLPVNCVTIGTAEVKQVWSSLKEFYGK